MFPLAFSRCALVMEVTSIRIAQEIVRFTEAHQRSLDVLAAAIERVTGDPPDFCFVRAWLLFKWARSQREPRVAAATMVRRMSERKAELAAAS